MLKKILIDANTTGRSAVVILDHNGELEECSFESNEKKTIKSNIFLGKVIRVEHSLQAAFVEYLPGKIGFLPFSEIHPNYYQIPIKDQEEIKLSIQKENRTRNDNDHGDNDYGHDDHQNDLDELSDTNDKEDAKYYYMLYKKYNIQEVIKRGQNILVQVFRDERGKKGVSLTTYISLPGRYCVLMPNSPKGIGVSKKIASLEDKKRIINIVSKFHDISDVSLVIRTAGLAATERELKRDYQYLIKLWNDIKVKTVQSSILSLVHEEYSLIEQVIRDNYTSNDTEAIIVNNNEVYHNLKKFLKLLIPGEEGKLMLYNDYVHIFKKYDVDKKLNKLLSERVELKSGGYLIINITEALTAIDVNSGKAIQEKNIEETAVKINLEATYEIARQLKLRNIGGLIVVDFIDMIDIKHRKNLEYHLKKAFMNDKAKVQFTRISMFGLVEISRQRMRSSLTELLTSPCKMCNSTGHTLSIGFIANDIINTILEKLQNPKSPKKPVLEILCHKDISSFIINNNIDQIKDIENKFNIAITISDIALDKYDDFIVRMLNEIGDLKTAIEIYNHKMTQLANSRENRGIFARLMAKIASKKK